MYQLMPEQEISLLKPIAKNSFGMYLFHSPLVYIMYTYFADIPPVLMVLINFVILGGASFVLTNIIRISKFKFIIGE